MSKTFCIIPWIHTQVKPNGQIKPCCRFDHKHFDYENRDKTYKFDRFNIANVDFVDAINSPEWQEIRDAMVAGDRVPGCRRCYQEEYFQFSSQAKNEKRKIKSMRVKENWMWNNDNQLNIDSKDTTQLRYIELAFGNYCNLKCRTCSADLSSTWIEDENKLSQFYGDRKYSDSVVNVEKEWNIEDFKVVEEIKFTGGEPMLHPNFIKTIDMIISTGRQHLITLDIFTNASWVPKDKVLDRLKQFKKVTINLSVDGIGYVNDYIRFPSEWSTVKESAKEWLITEKDNSTIFVIKWAPVISVFNIWLFHKMIEWWFGLQKEVKNLEWWDSIVANEEADFEGSQLSAIINIVHDPEYLKPSLYPKKLLLTSKLIDHRDMLTAQMNASGISDEKKWVSELNIYNIYNKILGALNEELDKDQLKMFVEYTADLDKLRGQDIRINLPDLWKRIDGMVEYKGRINE